MASGLSFSSRHRRASTECVRPPLAGQTSRIPSASDHCSGSVSDSPSSATTSSSRTSLSRFPSAPAAPASAQFVYYNGPVAQMPALVTSFLDIHQRCPAPALSLSPPSFSEPWSTRPPPQASFSRFTSVDDESPYAGPPLSAAPNRTSTIASSRRARKRRVDTSIAAELGHIRAALGLLDRPPALSSARHHAAPSTSQLLPRSTADFDSLLRIATSAGGPPPSP